jgi:hypothetical protein
MNIYELHRVLIYLLIYDPFYDAATVSLDWMLKHAESQGTWKNNTVTYQQHCLEGLRKTRNRTVGLTGHLKKRTQKRYGFYLRS